MTNTANDLYFFKEETNFRFASKKLGLTYSCPTDRPQPIESKEQILDIANKWFKSKPFKYNIGKEYHENGEVHYHAFFEWQERVETENVKKFDIDGVHPNVINKPGSGWINYCGKHGDYITNFWEPCPWVMARDADTLEEAKAILWAKRPRDMMLAGDKIEKNLINIKKAKIMPTLYYGPYRNITWAWNMTLILEGPPGVGKTQWAKWWGAHNGGYFYCKKSLEALKYWKGEPVIIYDDIAWNNGDYLDDLFDVETGGNFKSRYKDTYVPPGPKIWLQNPGIVIPDPIGRIYGRRSEVQYWEADDATPTFFHPL